MSALVWPFPEVGLAPTDAADPRPGRVPGSSVWPWPTDRTEAAAATPPALCFDETELAVAAAAAAAGAALAARAQAAAEAQARQAAALERLASLFAEAARQHADQERAACAQLLELARVVLRAALGAGSRASGAVLAEITGELLAQAPEAAAARLLAEPGTAEALRPHLPELQRRAGLTALELVAEPALDPGVLQLCWPDGWAERAPGRIGQLIEEALAAHDPPALDLPNLGLGDGA